MSKMQSSETVLWLKAFEQNFAGLLPILSVSGDIKVGIIVYIIKLAWGYSDHWFARNTSKKKV